MDRTIPPEESLGDLFHRLTEDGRAFAIAEAKVVRTQAVAKVRSFKTAAILFVIAILLVIGAVVALLVGCVIALVPVVGAVGAGAIVAAGALIVAGLLAWIGVRSIEA